MKTNASQQPKTKFNQNGNLNFKLIFVNTEMSDNHQPWIFNRVTKLNLQIDLVKN